MIINKKNAITLVEILIAVFILAISGLPIFGLISFSTRSTREQEAESEVVNLAKEEMNRLMYVATYDEIMAAAGGGKDCTFASFSGGSGVTEVNRKGNTFKGKYFVYPHENSEIKFKIPKLKFHAPQGCSDGAEKNSDVVEDGFMPEMSLEELYPHYGKKMLVDICLEIQWKPAYQNTYPEKNKLVLYGRRYF